MVENTPQPMKLWVDVLTKIHFISVGEAEPAGATVLSGDQATPLLHWDRLGCADRIVNTTPSLG